MTVSGFDAGSGLEDSQQEATSQKEDAEKRLSDQGVGSGFGEPNSFEPEEDPDVQTGQG